MTALLYYLAKVAACSGLLLLYYHWALRNKAFHQWNRFYLLGAVALSLALPAVRLPFLTPAQSQDELLRLLQAFRSADGYLDGITVSATGTAFPSPEQWGLIAYGIVCAAFLSGLLLSVVKIKRLAKRCGVQVVENVNFVNTTEPGTSTLR